jgi:hypothetical protein
MSETHNQPFQLSFNAFLKTEVAIKRREFLGAGLVATAAGVLGKTAWSNGPGRCGAQDGCHVAQTGTEVELEAPAFRFELDTSAGLRASASVNKLSAQTLQLGGGSELDVDLDAAQERIWILGWKRTVSRANTSDPDQDPGYQEGYARPSYDDLKWRDSVNLGAGEESPASFTWGRTQVTIPSSAQGLPLSLTLGGFGLFDHRFMRVFLNGQEVGRRRVVGRWHEPLSLDLGPGSSARPFILFGGQNLIAVQLSEFVTRTARLDELDPLHAQSLPGSVTGPYQRGPFEQYLTVGSLPQKVPWESAHLVTKIEGSTGEAVFELRSGGLSALVTYRWNASEPVLHKFVAITNRGSGPVRILKVSLGNYRTEVSVTDGEVGFPVYLAGEFFVGLAHPYGHVLGQEGTVWLRQYPGIKLLPGETFHSMEAVYGVAKGGEARKCFLSHLQGRMRRVQRGHDHAFAIFEPFGGRHDGQKPKPVDETEDYVLDNLAKVAEGSRDSGCRFDYYSVDFWVDYHGDLTQTDPQRFPHGFSKIMPELKKLRMLPGLWIDSSWQAWSIGGNPAVQVDLSNDPRYAKSAGWDSLCRASEPVKSMYSRAFRYHIRENGVRLLKFDDFRPLCYNPRHDHLLGVYSTEAIGNAVIQFLHDLDAESPTVFLMLYWGYRSPWWLLHADTLSEPGLFMEASSPSSASALYARDSVTVGLDQAQWYCVDVPHLGKDSLGIWLSDWGWNSSIGSERWQEGFVMDICRGSLLAQPWTDTQWLSPPQREQMADFIALLKERADCFRNPRFIVGNPWKNEPYGYACSNGKRAFIALNNCTWKDVSLTLELNPSWGLPPGGAFDLYRWYPHPAQLTREGGGFSPPTTLALRPFEIVLLEAVPAGEAPSLNRRFSSQPGPVAFREPSRELAMEVAATSSGLAIKGELPGCETRATLAIEVRMKKASLGFRSRAVGENLVLRGRLAGRDVLCQPVLGKKVIGGACWQAWCVPVEASPEIRPFEFSLDSSFEKDVVLTAAGHFLPQNEHVA